MMTDSKIGEIATAVLKRRFADAGFLNAEAATEEDFDGGPIVRVTAHFARSLHDLRKFVSSVGAIRDELSKSGEERFIILTHDYPGSESELDEDGEDEGELAR